MTWIATLVILMALAVPDARAEDFTFTFSGGISSPGTVTGGQVDFWLPFRSFSTNSIPR